MALCASCHSRVTAQEQRERRGREPTTPLGTCPPANDTGGESGGRVRKRPYLQPGVSVVWPGGWHLALASFGPPPLLPGPNDGSASAAGASTPSTPRVANATAIRFLILSLQQRRVD